MGFFDCLFRVSLRRLKIDGWVLVACFLGRFPFDFPLARLQKEEKKVYFGRYCTLERQEVPSHGQLPNTGSETNFEVNILENLIESSKGNSTYDNTMWVSTFNMVPPLVLSESVQRPKKRPENTVIWAPQPRAKIQVAAQHQGRDIGRGSS